jgi:hypothetical protein
MIHFLFSSYDKKPSCWKKRVDLALVAADIAMSSPSRYSKYITADLGRVAASLRADGRFPKAALLYKEIVAKFLSQYPSTATTGSNIQAHCYNHAIYMRAENFTSAERMFVWALHALAATGGGTSLSSVDPKITEYAFQNMISIYPHWEAKNRRDGGSGSASTEECDGTLEIALRLLFWLVQLAFTAARSRT